MEIENLKFLDIRIMLEKNHNQKRLDELIIMILHEKELLERTKMKDFFNGLTISDEILEKYNDGDTIYYLALYGALPNQKIISMALESCSQEQLFDLFISGKISVQAFEDKIISWQDPYWYLQTFKLLPKYGLNYNRLIEEFIKLKEKKDDNYFKSIYILLLDQPYCPAFIELAEILSKRPQDSIKLLNCWINRYYFKLECVPPKSDKDFPKFLKERPDILMLYKKIKDQLISNTEFEKILTNDYSDIKIGKRTDIAWCIDLYHFDEYKLEEIINEWARKGLAIAYDIYINYLLSDHRDYENVGKYLDQSYEKVLNEEASNVLKRVNKP